MEMEDPDRRKSPMLARTLRRRKRTPTGDT